MADGRKRSVLVGKSDEAEAAIEEKGKGRITALGESRGTGGPKKHC